MPPLTRFETVLAEGDVLYFPPAYFHTTAIHDERSVAAAYHLDSVPVYGHVPPHVYAHHPMGHGTCQWPKRTAAYRRWRQQHEEQRSTALRGTRGSVRAAIDTTGVAFVAEPEHAE